MFIKVNAFNNNDQLYPVYIPVQNIISIECPSNTDHAIIHTVHGETIYADYDEDFSKAVGNNT